MDSLQKKSGGNKKNNFIMKNSEDVKKKKKKKKKRKIIHFKILIYSSNIESDIAMIKWGQQLEFCKYMLFGKSQDH